MDLYGLIGNPLSHSLSEKYFSDKFALHDIDAAFRNFLIPDISAFSGILDTYPQLKGLSVTSPFKREVIQYCDELDPLAEEVMAVNALKISRAGKKTYIKGYNTDVDGFAVAMLPVLGSSLPAALILGSGGAARAAALALKRMGISFRIISRRKGNGLTAYDELSPGLIRQHKLIINATPLGMLKYVGEAPPIPYQHLGSQHILFDLNYNPPMTAFMKKGKAQNASVHNGLIMLQAQAEKAWHIWQS